MQSYDVVVVGGGPAGCAAALWLARYRRTVLLLDGGRPRNAPTWAVHGYPGIPDPSPDDLRRRFEEQLLAAGAVRRQAHVSGVRGAKGEFRVKLRDAGEVSAERVLLAYGLNDRLPDIPHLEELYGRSLFHCPDCDGPSMTGCTVGVLGRDKGSAGLALYLLTWADRVLLLTNGAEPDLPDPARGVLERNGVEVVTTPLSRPVLRGGALAGYELQDGPVLPVTGLFFHLGARPSSPIARELGCTHDEHGYVEVERSQETSVEGVYAAGDLTGKPHLVIAAAADGVRAALALHRSLLPAEFEL